MAIVKRLRVRLARWLVPEGKMVCRHGVFLDWKEHR